MVTGGMRADYLRISVTDKCNLRCRYCMPKDGIAHKSHAEILRFEEIIRLVRLFTRAGIRRVRLTGGEPLVRKGILDLIKRLRAVRGIDELCLTTNGALLKGNAAALRSAGIDRINISLDTLRPDRFRMITGTGELQDVLDGIDAVQHAGFTGLKLNMVVMRDVNSGEITDFATFAFSRGIVLRYIEFMNVTPLWDRKYLMPLDEIKAVCDRAFGLTKTDAMLKSVAEYYRTEGAGILGFIRTDTGNCRVCSRLRLTADGRVKVCLYEENGLSLKTMMRNGSSDTEIFKTIQGLIDRKQEVDFRQFGEQKQYMCVVGG